MPHSFVPQNAHQMSVLVMQNKYDIRDQIMAIYRAHQEHIVSSLGTAHSNRITNDHFGDEVSEQICSASLAILTNGTLALYKHKVVNNNKYKQNINHDERDYYCFDEEEQPPLKPSFIEMFVPLLIEAVAKHMICTNNACLALQCLEAMIIHSSRAREMLQEMEGGDQYHGSVGTIVEEARLYGCREHLKLEQTATSMMEVLGQCEVGGSNMLGENHACSPKKKKGRG